MASQCNAFATDSDSDSTLYTIEYIFTQEMATTCFAFTFVHCVLVLIKFCSRVGEQESIGFIESCHALRMR